MVVVFVAPAGAASDLLPEFDMMLWEVTGFGPL